jgi:Ca2+-dependent lipid-binding protein
MIGFSGSGASLVKEIKTFPAPTVRATIELRFLSGDGLAARDANGSSDPYCEAHVWCPDDANCSHKWRTSTRLATLNPKWDEREVFTVTTTNAFIHLLCFDWDRVGKDDFLGEVPISVRDYLDGKPHLLDLELIQLDPASSKEPITGSLRVELKATATPSSG